MAINKALNLIVTLACVAIAVPSWSADGTMASTYQSPTRIQRQPYQGGVSRTGLRAPVYDNEYVPQTQRGRMDSGIRDQGSLDSGVSDHGSLNSGVYDTAPLGGGVFNRGPSNFGATVDIGGTPMTTTSQLQLLSTRNVAILVDRSTSMHEKDCPGHISRWRWIQDQAELFSEQTAGVLNERFTLGLFSHSYDIYPNVSLGQMRQLFERTHLKIGTHPEGALREIFDAYFRGAMGSKPLAIAIVSDGEPNDPEKVADVIKQATWQMRSPDQIAITFLQVGHDGGDNLREFDQQLRRQGAKYDIVDCKSFYELQRLGLLGALVASIKEHMPAVAKTAPPKAKSKPKIPAVRPAMRHR
ncbi:MAG: hypothetical protein K2Y22_16850 [Candidatus Obscuribacterales bacterium]|nr:hypothetical protein [Candidatus Obscuribacterales bacterium]